MKRKVRRWVTDGGRTLLNEGADPIQYREKQGEAKNPIDITFDDGEPEPQGEWMEANPIRHCGVHEGRHLRQRGCEYRPVCRPEPQEAKGEVLTGEWHNNDYGLHMAGSCAKNTTCRPVEIRFKVPKPKSAEERIEEALKYWKDVEHPTTCRTVANVMARILRGESGEGKG